MSLGSSDMAGTTLGAAFSFLLYASVIQGLPDVERHRSETAEAEVGQNIKLRCIINNIPDLKIVNIEWHKKNTKLAVYNPIFGAHKFWPNVTIEAVNITDKELMGTYLHLPAVNEWDSGIYTCDIANFPYGSIRRETELKIKDVLKVTCSEDRAVYVRSGENVRIHCKASANAQHRWTKNKMLVSESESLELWQVTDAHAGVYTLTVNRGNESLCKEFIITVLTATTSSWTDLSTVSPQSYVTEEGLTEPAESSFTTSSTTGFSSHDTSVTWTMSAGTNITDDDLRPRNVTIAAGENITSFTRDAHVSVTSAPATPTHTDPFHHVNSTTLSYSYTVFRSTQETATDEAKNKSMPHRPEDVFSNMTKESGTTRNITQSYDATPAPTTATPGTGTERSHLAVLIIVAILLLIVVAGLLYRRHLIKQRMALPPPFKPPPPPVKYTAARHEISTQPFPTSRCNSVAYDAGTIC